MAKKNLSRSALEGGRNNSNKYERRQSHIQERRATRDFCNKVKIDPELALDEDPEERKIVSKEFTDKLNPMYRWLESKVGQKWSDIRSEVFEKFDIRTTAGRHILFDHLLSSVIDTLSGFDRYGNLVDPAESKLENKKKKYYFSRAWQDYYVDKNDILFKIEHKKSSFLKISEQECLELGNWLNGQMILEKGGILYWCSPNEGLWKSSWIEPGKPYDFYKKKLNYYLFDNGLHYLPGGSELAILYGNGFSITNRIHGDYWNLIEKPFSFKQRGQLSEEDAKIFRSLQTSLQEEILSFTKGR